LVCQCNAEHTKGNAKKANEKEDQRIKKKVKFLLSISKKGKVRERKWSSKKKAHRGGVNFAAKENLWRAIPERHYSRRQLIGWLACVT
jgi:hypothetical protein